MSNQPDGCEPSLAAASLDPGEAAARARQFKALGDPVRLRLLSMIASAHGEVCVCQLTGAFDVSPQTISHHLRVLREADLVSADRRGTWVYYRPVVERLRDLADVLDISRELV
ncbi:MAG: ArsR/SmtB family transcription factor [Stackebrandtia sp.]